MGQQLIENALAYEENNVEWMDYEIMVSFFIFKFFSHHHYSKKTKVDKKPGDFFILPF